jgi:hypothetical protein
MTAKEIQHANQQAFLQFCNESVPELKPTQGNFQKCYLQLLADGVEPDQVIPSHAYGASYFKVKDQLDFKIPEPKSVKLRTDDINSPGRTGKLTNAEKQEEERKIAKAREDRKATIDNAATRRARLEAEARIAQHRVVTNGRVNWAATRTEQKRMTDDLNRPN